MVGWHSGNVFLKFLAKNRAKVLYTPLASGRPAQNRVHPKFNIYKLTNFENKSAAQAVYSKLHCQ